MGISSAGEVTDDKPTGTCKITPEMPKESESAGLDGAGRQKESETTGEEGLYIY